MSDMSPVLREFLISDDTLWTTEYSRLQPWTRRSDKRVYEVGMTIVLDDFRYGTIQQIVVDAPNVVMLYIGELDVWAMDRPLTRLGIDTDTQEEKEV